MNQNLLSSAANALTRLRSRAPRVQCLTNTVAQQITANTLLALGCRVSMAAHPDEVVAMTESAAALLVNLGTLDAGRVAALKALAQSHVVRAMPVVLDPVFAEHSPVRLALARDVLGWERVIVKGNGAEMAALPPDVLERTAARVVTGAVDRVVSGAVSFAIASGAPVMGQVTGFGCALGAVIAAAAAVEPDPAVACAAGLLMMEVAGDIAVERSHGPGSFAVAHLDAVAALTPHDILSRAKLL